MHTYVALVALLGACGGHGVVTPAKPVLACEACGQGDYPGPIATYTVVKARTSWYGECWSSLEHGIHLPTPGGDGKQENYPCQAVSHKPSVRCVGGECLVTRVPATKPPETPLDVGDGVNERYYQVVVVSPGDYELSADFARRKSPAHESIQLRVLRPDRIELACRTEVGRAVVDLKLAHDDQTLMEGPPAVALAAAGSACTQVSRYGYYNGVGYSYTCPIAPTGNVDMTATGTDFRITGSVRCT